MQKTKSTSSDLVDALIILARSREDSFIRNSTDDFKSISHEVNREYKVLFDDPKSQKVIADLLARYEVSKNAAELRAKLEAAFAPEFKKLKESKTKDVKSEFAKQRPEKELSLKEWLQMKQGGKVAATRDFTMFQTANAALRQAVAIRTGVPKQAQAGPTPPPGQPDPPPPLPPPPPPEEEPPPSPPKEEPPPDQPAQPIAAVKAAEPAKAGEESAKAGEEPEAGKEPAKAGEEPEAGKEPAKAGEEPAKAGEESAKSGAEAANAGGEPAKAGGEPEAGKEPAKAGEEPADEPTQPGDPDAQSDEQKQQAQQEAAEQKQALEQQQQAATAEQQEKREQQVQAQNQQLEEQLRMQEEQLRAKQQQEEKQQQEANELQRRQQEEQARIVREQELLQADQAAALDLQRKAQAAASALLLEQQAREQERLAAEHQANLQQLNDEERLAAQQQHEAALAEQRQQQEEQQRALQAQQQEQELALQAQQAQDLLQKEQEKQLQQVAAMQQQAQLKQQQELQQLEELLRIKKEREDQILAQQEQQRQEKARIQQEAKEQLEQQRQAQLQLEKNEEDKKALEAQFEAERVQQQQQHLSEQQRQLIKQKQERETQELLLQQQEELLQKHTQEELIALQQQQQQALVLKQEEHRIEQAQLEQHERMLMQRKQELEIEPQKQEFTAQQEEADYAYLNGKHSLQEAEAKELQQLEEHQQAEHEQLVLRQQKEIEKARNDEEREALQQTHQMQLMQEEKRHTKERDDTEYNQQQDKKTLDAEYAEMRKKADLERISQELLQKQRDEIEQRQYDLVWQQQQREERLEKLLKHEQAEQALLAKQQEKALALIEKQRRELEQVQQEADQVKRELQAAALLEKQQKEKLLQEQELKRQKDMLEYNRQQEVLFIRQKQLQERLVSRKVQHKKMPKIKQDASQKLLSLQRAMRTNMAARIAAAKEAANEFKLVERMSSSTLAMNAAKEKLEEAKRLLGIRNNDVIEFNGEKRTLLHYVTACGTIDKELTAAQIQTEKTRAAGTFATLTNSVVSGKTAHEEAVVKAKVSQDLLEVNTTMLAKADLVNAAANQQLMQIRKLGPLLPVEIFDESQATFADAVISIDELKRDVDETLETQRKFEEYMSEVRKDASLKKRAARSAAAIAKSKRATCHDAVRLAQSANANQSKYTEAKRRLLAYNAEIATSEAAAFVREATDAEAAAEAAKAQLQDLEKKFNPIMVGTRSLFFKANDMYLESLKEFSQFMTVRNSMFIGHADQAKILVDARLARAKELADQAVAFAGLHRSFISAYASEIEKAQSKFNALNGDPGSQTAVMVFIDKLREQSAKELDDATREDAAAEEHKKEIVEANKELQKAEAHVNGLNALKKELFEFQKHLEETTQVQKIVLEFIIAHKLKVKLFKESADVRVLLYDLAEATYDADLADVQNLHDTQRAILDIYTNDDTVEDFVVEADQVLHNLNDLHEDILRLHHRIIAKDLTLLSDFEKILREKDTRLAVFQKAIEHVREHIDDEITPLFDPKILKSWFENNLYDISLEEAAWEKLQSTRDKQASEFADLKKEAENQQREVFENIKQAYSTLMESFDRKMLKRGIPENCFATGVVFMVGKNAHIVKPSKVEACKAVPTFKNVTEKGANQKCIVQVPNEEIDQFMKLCLGGV